MEGRMTVCNMTIEGGAPRRPWCGDDTTSHTCRAAVSAPASIGGGATATLQSDPVRTVDRGRTRRVANRAAGDLGHLAGDGAAVDAGCPTPTRRRTQPPRRDERALHYMGLEPGKAVNDIFVDKVFIGSCTNSRIEDMREAAAVVKKLGQKVAGNVKLAMVVPGSGVVKEQAEREGLHEIFRRQASSGASRAARCAWP
jgi:3-isopropylmalate/(R)-2-methylmalate dehydratase large subunit